MPILTLVASLPVIVLIVGALCLAVVLNVNYSDGDRTGYLQKCSRKGWICKTYEDEPAITTVPRVAPVLWPFSIWDEKVAQDVKAQLGKHVIVHY